MNGPILSTSKLCVQSGKKFLVKDISWTIKKGEHWVIFGLNGSGKTTLLSVLAGFRKQTSGKVAIFGEEYGAHNVLALRKRIGWISSSFFDTLYAKESVLQIVLSGIWGTLGISDKFTDDDIVLAQKFLDSVGLGDKIDHSFNMLSKGERQNVLIARALISQPEILLLDEPATGLDVVARASLLSTVDYLARETDITIIYVTHYPEEILGCFQHCMLLKHGRCYKKGDTKEIMTTDIMTNFLCQDALTRLENDQFLMDVDAQTPLIELVKRTRSFK